MKRIFAVLLVLAAALTLSACGRTEDSVDVSQLPQIIMVKVHENYAEGAAQSVTVIDRAGNVRSQSCFGDYVSVPENWVYLSEGGWYDALLEISESGEQPQTLSESTLTLIQRNAQYFSDWSGLPETDYGTQMFDYGEVALYGVYLDGGGEPRLSRLANDGDTPRCKSSGEVRAFVNETGLLSFNFT